MILSFLPLFLLSFPPAHHASGAQGMTLRSQADHMCSSSFSSFFFFLSSCTRVIEQGRQHLEKRRLAHLLLFLPWTSCDLPFSFRGILPVGKEETEQYISWPTAFFSSRIHAGALGG